MSSFSFSFSFDDDDVIDDVIGFIVDIVFGANLVSIVFSFSSLKFIWGSILKIIGIY